MASEDGLRDLAEAVREAFTSAHHNTPFGEPANLVDALANLVVTARDRVKAEEKIAEELSEIEGAIRGVAYALEQIAEGYNPTESQLEARRVRAEIARIEQETEKLQREGG